MGTFFCYWSQTSVCVLATLTSQVHPHILSKSIKRTELYSYDLATYSVRPLEAWQADLSDVLGQSSLQSEFQATNRFTVKLCFKKRKQQKREKENY